MKTSVIGTNGISCLRFSSVGSCSRWIGWVGQTRVQYKALGGCDTVTSRRR